MLNVIQIAQQPHIGVQRGKHDSWSCPSHHLRPAPSLGQAKPLASDGALHTTSQSRHAPPASSACRARWQRGNGGGPARHRRLAPRGRSVGQLRHACPHGPPRATWHRCAPSNQLAHPGSTLTGGIDGPCHREESGTATQCNANVSRPNPGG